MYFIAGAGMLFVAFLLVLVGFRLLSRPGARIDPEAFGVSEAISLVFTGLVAFGIAALMHGTVAGDLPASLAELGVSLAVLFVACIAARFAVNKAFPRYAVAPTGATPPPADLRGRPGHDPRPAKPAGSKARRAA